MPYYSFYLVIDTFFWISEKSYDFIFCFKMIEEGSDFLLKLFLSSSSMHCQSKYLPSSNWPIQLANYRHFSLFCTLTCQAIFLIDLQVQLGLLQTFPIGKESFCLVFNYKNRLWNKQLHIYWLINLAFHVIRCKCGDTFDSPLNLWLCW